MFQDMMRLFLALELPKSGLDRLQQLDQSVLQNAVDRAFRGDTAGAKEALSPLLADRQVQQLSEQMRDGHGGV